MTVIVKRQVREYDPPPEWQPVYRIGISTDPTMQDLKQIIDPLVLAVVQLQERVAALELEATRRANHRSLGQSALLDASNTKSRPE